VVEKESGQLGENSGRIGFRSGSFWRPFPRQCGKAEGWHIYFAAPFPLCGCRILDLAN